MNVHELTLQNYSAASGCPSACQPMLYLGTAGSYGNEQINVVLGEGWQGLTVKADAQKYIDDRLTAVKSHIQEIAAAQLNAQTGG